MGTRASSSSSNNCNATIGNVMLPEGIHLDTFSDCFELILDDAIIGKIVYYTNKEAATHEANFTVIDWIELETILGLLIIAVLIVHAKEIMKNIVED